MSPRCSLVVNGKAVRVASGDTTVEAAMADGMIAPTQATHGTGVLGQAPGPASRRITSRAHRPEAGRLASFLPTHAVERPDVVPAATARRAGTLTEVTPLSPHVLQAVVTLTRPLPLEPGHQVEITLPGRRVATLSPSFRVDGGAELNELVFHLPRNPEAPALAEALGNAIPLGALVRARGPLGRAYYRPGAGRLVLVSDGTGFAQVWAIARAARYLDSERPMVLVVGAADPLDLYMRPALDWLRATGVERIVLAAERNRQRPPDVRPGPLTAHIPHLRTTDIVHVCGSPATVGAVEVLAAAAGARCYPVALAGD